MTPLHINDEKGQKERASDLNQKLQHDAEEGKRIMEEPLGREGLMTLKTSHLGHSHLSDSENEEPLLGRISHRSAFVLKGNCNTLTSLAWNINSKIERSQSCNDTLNESGLHSKRRTTLAEKAKVHTGGFTSTGILGVLLSKENSRSFSAPVLTSEKRLSVNSLTSFTPLHKPERSISPESNDSISEELNHFKPIVCSPCTPPKRLPDGRVLSPVIIKSTPRNLRKSLQKPTTYEASPVILKKWEQVFQERQMKRTLSKGTLTTSTGVEDARTQNNNLPSKKKLNLNVIVSSTNVIAHGDLEPSSSKELGPQTNNDKNINLSASEFLSDSNHMSEDSTTKEHMDTGKATAQQLSKVKTLPPCKCLGDASMKPPVTRPHKKHSQTKTMQNGLAGENITLVFPQRRGQKRRCKTKHLEQNGSRKRLKLKCGDSCTQGFELLLREAEKRLHQEEEDKKFALKLQQMFDKETRTVNRCKGSRDEYPLRSKSTAGAN
ncbi:E3 ubiquitin-protein ligase RNF169 isoform X2 [Bombina bombina]|uniref:E3 ubiquitin-protein ligase RNF169 isoform X2 n=1 Tax=Bombina bombina TaxID=8345 RepID=UPI00235AD25D|nr:E3 ubiquitin-protein ligase RNF169 isoform X2 [Bombina bombina]